MSDKLETQADDQSVGAKQRSMRPKKKAESSGQYKDAYDGSWAFVIGINRHAEQPLDYAVPDADAIARILVESFGFPGEQVLAIMDPPMPMREGDKELPYTLVSEQATKEAIEEVLTTKLPDKAAEDDRILFFYAGHAASRPVPDGEIGYLVPSSAGRGEWHKCVKLDTVLALGEESKAKHILFMFDACYSGLAVRGEVVASGFFEAEKLTHKSRQILAASAAQQVVPDRGTSGHSLFTHYVLQGLRGAALPSSKRGHALNVVTATDLIAYVKREVGLHLGSKQTPTGGPYQGHDTGGDFVFTLPSPGDLVNPDQRIRLGKHLYELGRLTNDRGRHEQAIRELTGVLRSDLTDEQTVEATARLGIVETALGRLTQAIDRLEPILDREDVPTEALIHLGIAQANQRLRSDAAATFRRVLKRVGTDRDNAWMGEYASKLEQPEPGKVQALLVGIEKYSSGDVPYSVNDVELIAASLNAKFQGPIGNIQVLRNGDATADNILAGLDDLVARAGPDDTVLVHFSGRTGFSGQSSFLLETQTRQLPNGNYVAIAGIQGDTLHGYLNTIRARRKFVMLDPFATPDYIDLVKRDASYSLVAATGYGMESLVARRDKYATAGILSITFAQLVDDSLDPYALTFGLLMDHLKENIAQERFTNPKADAQRPLLIGESDQSLFSHEDDWIALCEFWMRRNYASVSLEQIRALFDHAQETVQTSFPELYYGIGRAFMEKASYADAEAALQIAIEQSDGDYAEAAFELGKVHILLEDFAGAANDFEQASSCPEPAYEPAQLKNLSGLAMTLYEVPRQAHALLVGIDRYRVPEARQVRGAVSDAQRLKKILQERYRIPATNIVQLHNEQAKRENILERFDELVTKSKQGPALFYFAGYGSVDTDGVPTIVSADGRQGAIQDIALGELADRASDSGELVTIIDAGFTLFADRYAGSRTLSRDVRRTHVLRNLKVAVSATLAERIRGLRESLPIGLVSIYPHSIRLTALPSELEHEFRLEAEIANEDGAGSVQPHGILSHCLIEVLSQAGHESLTYRRWVDEVRERIGEYPAAVPEMLVHESFGESPLFGSWLPRLTFEQSIATIATSMVSRGMGGTDDAITVLDEIIERYRDQGKEYPEAYLAAALTLESTGDAARSLAYLTEADRIFDDRSGQEINRSEGSSLDKIHGEIEYHLGRLLFDSEQDINNAVVHLHHAVQMVDDITRNKVYYYLGRALWALAEGGILAEAAIAFEAYLAGGAQLGHDDDVQRFLGLQSVATNRSG